MATTIKDVARRSGVSTTTVSFVLNNTGSVGEAARERVLRAARELEYSPNPLARAMITRRSQSLGVLVNNVSSFIASAMLNGIEETARRAGYEILLALHRDDPTTALSAIQGLSARRVDAIIAVFAKADEHPDLAAALPTTGIPYVIAYYQAESLQTSMDNIVVDQEQGGYLATRHLLERGCRHLAFAGGPEERNATRLRQNGFERACVEAGISVPSAAIRYDLFEVEGGRRIARDFLQAGLPLEGIVAADDHIAAGVLQELRRAGRRVPEDVAVVGFNDSSLCPAVDPPLTSVRMPLGDIGCLCVERAMQRLEQPDSWMSSMVALPCTLTLRDSA